MRPGDVDKIDIGRFSPLEGLLIAVEILSRISLPLDIFDGSGL